MTHEPGGPWDRVVKEYKSRVPKYTTIPQSYIEERFKNSPQGRPAREQEGRRGGGRIV